MPPLYKQTHRKHSKDIQTNTPEACRRSEVGGRECEPAPPQKPGNRFVSFCVRAVPVMSFGNETITLWVVCFYLFALGIVSFISRHILLSLELNGSSKPAETKIIWLEYDQAIISANYTVVIFQYKARVHTFCSSPAWPPCVGWIYGNTIYRDVLVRARLSIVP